MARNIARWGAAAFALGISLAGPQAVAAAEDTEDSTSAAVANPALANPAAAPPPAAEPGQATTPPRSAVEPSGRSASANGDAARRPASEVPAPAEAVADRIPSVPAGTADRGARRAAAVAAATRRGAPAPTSVDRTGDLPGGAADTAAVTPAKALAGGPADANLAITTPAISDLLVTDPVASAPQTTAVPPAAAAPDDVAGVTVEVASATTPTSGGLGDPLSTVQSFIEGIALLVRRTFFNQAPTINPVQTTGQLTGPISGSIGAVDPEGDEIVYTLTRDAQFGTVVLASDGSYVYTPGADFAGLDTFVVSAADQGLHINLLDPFRPASTLANAMVNQGRPAWVQFDFRYSGAAFLWSPEARSTLAYAATILSSYLEVDAPVTVTYTADGQFAPLSGQLASATSDLISSRAGIHPTVVQQKIIAGTDVNGAQSDGTITWNFANPWALGESAAGGEYDFQSVAMHELMHTLGFLSTVGAPGDNTGTGWTAYDGLLVTADGTAVIGSDFRWNSAYDPNLTGGGGGLLFGGSAATAANGGPVPLFTPGTWQSGSSVSHLNDGVYYGRMKKLMTARVNTGTGVRTLSPVETGILTDLGYTIAGGSGGSAYLFIGLALFRRRRRPQPTP